jgi:hypothetical protein
MQISRIRLSDKTSRLRPRHVVPKPVQAYEPEVPVQVREWIAPALAPPPDFVLGAQPPTQPHSRIAVERPIRRSDGDRLPPSLFRATPSAASEHLSELIGFPISRSFTTYCVCLELRSLPSTGITRLPRYYEPLRHPRAPGLSLTGFRLAIADHALGLPVFRALSLCTCRRHYPGAASERIASLISSRRISLPR